MLLFKRFLAKIFAFFVVNKIKRSYRKAPEIQKKVLKELVENDVSDSDFKNSSNIFPINPPQNKEEFYYRTIFNDHFSSDAAAKSVPSVPSVACSTPEALLWDEAFKNINDPSGRSISNIHNESYE